MSSISAASSFFIQPEHRLENVREIRRSFKEHPSQSYMVGDYEVEVDFCEVEHAQGPRRLCGILSGKHTITISILGNKIAEGSAYSLREAIIKALADLHLQRLYKNNDPTEELITSPANMGELITFLDAHENNIYDLHLENQVTIRFLPRWRGKYEVQIIAANEISTSGGTRYIGLGTGRTVERALSVALNAIHDRIFYLEQEYPQLVGL